MSSFIEPNPSRGSIVPLLLAPASTARAAWSVSILLILVILLLQSLSPKSPSVIIRNAVSFGKDPVGFLRWAKAEYGEIFEVSMILRKTVWLRSNELNKFYLEMREDTWSFGDGMGLFLNKVVKIGYFDHLKAFVGSLNRGINRRVALDHYQKVARETSRSHFSQWAQKSETSIFEHVSALVHAIIVQCLMGPDFHAKNGDELFELLHAIEADIGNILNFVLPDSVPHPASQRLEQAKRRVEQIFHQRMEERESSPDIWKDANDYISYTLRDKATAHLKEFYAAHHTLLMFAAHTSTVASISWTIVELLKSPSRAQSLQDDLRSTPDSRASPYIQAFLKETARLYSGVGTFRLARQASYIPSTNHPPTPVPKGSVISISPYLTHRDPSVYPHADEWYPERWLENDQLSEELNSGGKVAYIPFGSGVHRCPGEKLANVIASTVIATLIQYYDVGWGRGIKGQEQQDFSHRLDFSKIGSPWLKGDACMRVGVKLKE